MDHPKNPPSPPRHVLATPPPRAADELAERIMTLLTQFGVTESLDHSRFRGKMQAIIEEYV